MLDQWCWAENCWEHLVHGDSSLDPGSHCIHPCTHPEEVDRLVLLPDGVFCMYSRHFHVSFLNGLGRERKLPFTILQSSTIATVKIYALRVASSFITKAYLLHFGFLSLFLFVTFLWASLQLLGSKLQIKEMLCDLKLRALLHYDEQISLSWLKTS